MNKRWNPWKSPPVYNMEFSDWLAEDLAAFVRANPDLPQKPISKLNAREHDLVFTAYDEQRNKTELVAARRKRPETEISSANQQKRAAGTKPVRKKH